MPSCGARRGETAVNHHRPSGWGLAVGALLVVGCDPKSTMDATDVTSTTDPTGKPHAAAAPSESAITTMGTAQTNVGATTKPNESTAPGVSESSIEGTDGSAPTAAIDDASSSDEPMESAPVTPATPNMDGLGGFGGMSNPETGNAVGPDAGARDGGHSASSSGFTACSGAVENWTSKPVIVFNDDGAWTWHTDERAAVDVAGHKLVLSSVANSVDRRGNIELTVYDLDTGSSAREAVGNLDPDDQNVGAVLVTSEAEYLSVWSGHNQNCNSYFSHYTAGAWSIQSTVDWTDRGCPWGVEGSMRSLNFNNLWRMAAEGEHTVYDFVRGKDGSPNLMVSMDDGTTWSPGGPLISPPGVGFTAGYYKYWGNGVDRIDFTGTEGHPRDIDTSLYHGYLQGGQLFNSLGEVIDADISDGDLPTLDLFTRVFDSGTTLGDATLTHAWTADVMRYADGSIAALWQARSDTNVDSPDHRFAYSRFDGSDWHSTSLGKTGPKLLPEEQDYVGGAALHPNDPRIVFISTTIDPRDGSTELQHHEIFMGTTCDDGATFSWSPVTQDSSVDNLRPMVPAWDEHNMVLLWFRGVYSAAQSYQAEVVGMIVR
jgi:hypothetical protein